MYTYYLHLLLAIPFAFYSLVGPRPPHVRRPAQRAQRSGLLHPADPSGRGLRVPLRAGKQVTR